MKNLTDRGVVLLTTVLLIAFITMGIVAFLDIATVDLQVLQNNRYSDEALYIAQAGIEDAISRLRQDINWGAIDITPLVVEFPEGSGNYYSVVCSGQNTPRTITSTARLANGYKREILAGVHVSGTSSLYKVVVNYWKES